MHVWLKDLLPYLVLLTLPHTTAKYNFHQNHSENETQVMLTWRPGESAAR